MKHELTVDHKAGGGEGELVYRWRCSCSSHGRIWEDRHLDAEEAWLQHKAKAEAV